MIDIDETFEGVSKERMEYFIKMLPAFIKVMQKDPPPGLSDLDAYCLLREAVLKYPGEESDETWIVLMGLCARHLFKAIESGEVDVAKLSAMTATA